MSESKSNKVFTNIYKTRVWGTDGGGSGRGSTIQNAQRTSEVLHEVLDKYQLNSLLDAPCGALVWTEGFIQKRQETDPSFDYCGVDVVAHVIESVRDRVDLPNLRLEVCDLVEETPPKGYDLILCRDALQHLDMSGVAGVFANFAKTGSKYLLVSTYPSDPMDETPNKNIERGKVFRIDLSRAPFEFSEGLLDTFDDRRPTGNESGQTLALYDLNVLKASAPFKAFVADYAEADSFSPLTVNPL